MISLRLGRRTASLVVIVLLGWLASSLPAGADQTEDSTDPPDGIVVKMDIADGYRISDVEAGFPVVVDSAVLASRGIYRVHPTDPKYLKEGKSKELAGKIQRAAGVVYAEPDEIASLLDTRFHAWPEGSAEDAGTDPAVWLDQQAISELRLGEAHQDSLGAGVVVAVLDTGADMNHPALQNRLVPGWDYVDDDSDPSEEAPGIPDGTGHADTAYGHGTFVSGVTAMVAPDAGIMPLRVLDSNGRGNVFAVAQALLDAAAAGAQVVNLSFGTPTMPSKLLDETIKDLRKRGIVVVAAAGNSGNDKKQYPAAQPEVMSVAALGTESGDLASFSGFGDWIDVAAPGDDIAGPVPGGRYAWWRGTSIAAPFVAGQVALVRSMAPKLAPAKVFEAVLRTTDKLNQGHRVHSGSIDVVGSLDFTAAHD